jgi:ankyrin repeat protein
LRDNRGQSPLFVASHHGHYDVVKCLLSSGADINLRDKDGHLPKFVALSSKYYDIFALFNSNEENVKAQYIISHSKEKQGEEKEAICNGYLTHLLKIGLDINKHDYSGNTLLYRILNAVYIFKHLMEHFKDVNVGEKNGLRY